MPLPDANEPLRTTDHAPTAAPPAPDVTTDHAPGSSVVDGPTGAYVPGRDAEALGIVPERGPTTVSVPGYEIEGVLGRGGMGVVYKARHLTLKRTVALKMILARGHAGPGELARFRIEAEAVARLQHPNIVQIHEVGEADGHPYCALEFVEGGTLASKLGGQPMPAREAAKLVEALARAMQLAHSRNVVHRDLKPANILLAADGTPKITDFGLARQMDNDSGETQAGAVMGTPSYMAPEQASGSSHEAGPAADVYALGAILYDCLAGRPPFKGKTVVETLDQVRTQEPVPPSRLHANISPDLEAVCLKCLEKSPTHRYASAQDLADDLERWRNGDATRARPWSWRRRLTRRTRRHWKPLAAALLVLLAAGAVLFTVVVSRPEYRAEQAMLGVDRAIRSGERVVLVGSTGPPKWFRQPVDITTVSADPSSVFQVDAGSGALIELAPAAHHDRYRLSAEVRTRTSKTTDSSSGIYFAHNQGPANPAGFVERLVVVRHRRNLMAHDPVNGEAVNVHDFLLLSRDGVTRLLYPNPFGVHYYKSNPLQMIEPWRYLEVEVTPETIRARWREEDGSLQMIGRRNEAHKTVDAIPVDILLHQGTQRHAKLLDGNQYKDVPRRIEYNPRGALGLYVEKAVVDFRNVVYEPLAVEPAP